MKIFHPTSKSHWLDKVTKDLKGKTLDSLSWQVDDIELTPFYHADDEVTSSITSMRQDNSWQAGMRILVNESNIESSNLKILQWLNQGANRIQFVFEQALTMNGLQRLFKNIHLEWIASQFNMVKGKISPIFMEAIYDAILLNDENPCEVDVSFDGSIYDFHKIEQLISAMPKAKFFYIATHDEESVTGELADLAHKTNSIIDDLVDYEMSFDRIASLFNVHITLDDRYFVNIAKVRAWRVIIAQIMDAWKLPLESWIWTSATVGAGVSDEDVNTIKLKQTSQAMSAVIAGIDSICILPSNDHVVLGGDSFNNRIALNINHILLSESYLDQVVDPAAGSYFIESLTNQLAEQAWHMFQNMNS